MYTEQKVITKFYQPRVYSIEAVNSWGTTALHFKLGLIKSFVKAMDKEAEWFAYLRAKFPGLSDAKIKEGIFIGPQIRKLLKNNVFKEKTKSGTTKSMGFV